MRPPSDVPDEEAIRDLVSRAQDAQGDPETLLAMRAPDVVIVNLAGRRVLGRESFAAAMDAALASPLSKVRSTTAIVDLRIVMPDVAIVSCLKTVHDQRNPVDVSRALPSTGALTYVVTRKAGEWQISLAQTTPIL
jgi:uncharacterized protein (TIGR02246 family)